MRAAILVLLAACATSYGRSENDVVFARYSPLSRNAEIARRALPPLTYQRFQQTLAARRLTLSEQAIDLAKERFDLYVPPGPPPARGYGLLVYISPDAGPLQPRFWRAPLDRHGLIFVCPRNAGNDANVLDRRAPLALNELAFPGWTVEVDGEPALPLRANYVMRAVYVAPGHHAIRWRFEPRGRAR
jgi:hypothetical protein